MDFLVMRLISCFESSANKNLSRRIRCWWLTAVILATQEAEIRRIEV
jgi:hypothetical protein